MDHAAIISICGYSGSGKTTLIEQLLLELNREEINVAVIKHHHKPIQNDIPGKDTDRFYQAGAAVLSLDGESVFFKSRCQRNVPLKQAIDLLGNAYDIILAEGFKDSNIPKLWLCRPDETQPRPEIKNIIKVLPWNNNRLNLALPILHQYLENHQVSNSRQKDNRNHQYLNSKLTIDIPN